MRVPDQDLADPLASLLGPEGAQPLLDALSEADDSQVPAALQQIVAAAEQAIWNSDRQGPLAAPFQAMFGALEARLCRLGLPRHHIHLVIPVADRPLHLRACVDSLQRLIEAFPYAGKLTLMVADDSADPENQLEQQRITEQVASGRLETLYFGPRQQWALYDRLPPEQRAQLRNLLDQPHADRMGHKGASVTRNLAYLALRQLAATRQRPLFFFVDSDQEFHADTRHAEPVYTINYFYHLDRLFRERPIEVLTGKVVGDPPVSPAVMAATLLEDVLGFLDEVVGQPAAAACTLHQAQPPTAGAAYHDMAGLFGFERRAGACRYRCQRDDVHSLGDTVLDFAQGLARFFDGEHPTRRTDFVPTPVDASLAPARTVYTGNYVLTADALEHCIPFAAQRLRMAGPTLGRLLQASIGPRFVSANLPMLHRRTHRTLGVAEFRPGVRRQRQAVDLSGEYLRQFLGDLMLFSVEQLVGQGYPGRFERQALAAAIDAHASQLLTGYLETRTLLLQRLAAVQRYLQERADWFASDRRLARAATLLQAFATQIQANYTDQADAVRRLGDTGFVAQQRRLLVDALLAYPDDMRHWRSALAAAGHQVSPFR